jgi:crotonobetainyl-CoA:carnitine CoA-transferase CaiB-like acyl-CoA transferase
VAVNDLMQGVAVLELGNGIAGSVLGKLMVDQAATVTKVPFAPLADDEPEHIRTAFAVWDLGKRLLPNPTEAELDELLATADLVIDQEWCAGRAPFAGLLGYERFKARNPRGVYLTISTGLPFAVESLRVRDLEGLVAARAGMYSNNFGIETPAYIDIPVASVGTAIQSSVACAAAITECDRSGKGCEVRVELSTAPVYAKGISFVQTPYGDGIIGNAGLGISGTYEAADGRWMVLSLPAKRLTARMLRVLNQAEFPVDRLSVLNLPQAAISPEQAAEARAQLVAIFKTQPADYWDRLLSGNGVPCMTCRHPSEWLANEQALTTGVLREVELEGRGPVCAVGTVLRSS